MFIQVIKGRAKDARALGNAMDDWHARLRPGATGYLGSTGGDADDGTFVMVVRFESEDAARANSERPDQGEWWNTTQTLFDGAPQFYDCRVVDVWGNPSDDAGFVQVMIGRTSDVAGMRKMGAAFDEQSSDWRPDVLGATDAYTTDGTFVSTIYFTSEAEAREGEKKMQSDPRAQEMMQQFAHLFEGETTYIDLREPWLRSA